MSIVTFPTTLAVCKQSWGQQRNDVEFRSMFGAQAVEGSVPLWTCTLSAPTDLTSLAGPWQALMLSLRGRQNQLAMWNKGRPVPLGTMRGTMLTGSVHAAGTIDLYITATGQGYTTLLQGDYLGFGSGANQQVVMVILDAVADSSGTFNVRVEPPLRNTFGLGSPITWNMPCALFRRKDSALKWDYEPRIVGGMMLDLLEDPRP